MGLPRPCRAGSFCDRSKNTSATELTAGCAVLTADQPVLTGRIAAALARHDPGWQLPRLSTLARQHGVNTAEVAAVIGELAARRLVRRLPGGRFCRASPADYHVPLAGEADLSVRIDPIAGTLACRSRNGPGNPLPEDIATLLGADAGKADAGKTVSVVRLLHTVDDEPAAVSTTYLAGPFDALLRDAVTAPCPAVLPLMSLAAAPGNDQEASGTRNLRQFVHLEMQQPSAGTARALRLPACQQAIVITARLDDPASATPAALTVAVLRPGLFRVAIKSADMPRPRSREGARLPRSEARRLCGGPPPKRRKAGNSGPRELCLP